MLCLKFPPRLGPPNSPSLYESVFICKPYSHFLNIGLHYPGVKTQVIVKDLLLTSLFRIISSSSFP